MSVNIQQADKTLKKVANTTVINKATVIGALEYTPVTPTELNTAKTDLTAKDGDLQNQINALKGSTFDGDYDKLKNAPILNIEDGTFEFVDDPAIVGENNQHVLARFDDAGLTATNLHLTENLDLNGDIDLNNEKLEIIDETGNIVLRIDDNGVETKNINEIKKQLSDIDAQAKANANNISNIQEDLEIFNFDDEGGLTLADEQGNIIAKFDVAEDGSQTGLITTDVTFEYEEDKTKTLTALNAEVATNTTEIGKNTKSIGDNAATIATKAPIANPEFTGIPTAPTPAEGASATQIATVGYVTSAVSEVAQDVADLPFEFNDDGALTIADEGGNILAQFAVEEDAQGNVIETGLKVTDVIIADKTTPQISVTKKFSDIDSALNERYTKSETNNQIDTKVAALVDTAPETLNTLNELAAALGDDPNFATTVSTELGKKANTTDVNNQIEALDFYKTVKVGSTPIEAEGNDDILTFKAGSNVMLNIEAENKTITISAVDKGATSIDTSGQGNAVTGANYDTTSRKITLNKGETFATKEEYDGFVNEFNSNFNLTNENGALEIVDDPEVVGEGNENVLARFDIDGLTTVGATFTNPITVGEPEADTDAATKKYVDDATTPFIVKVGEDGVADKTYGELKTADSNGETLLVHQTFTTAIGPGVNLKYYREYEYVGFKIGEDYSLTYKFSSAEGNVIYNCEFVFGADEDYIVVTFEEDSLVETTGGTVTGDLTITNDSSIFLNGNAESTAIHFQNPEGYNTPYITYLDPENSQDDTANLHLADDMGDAPVIISGVAAPRYDNHAANKKYVDDAVSSFSSKVFQIAASTDENLNTNLFLLDSADDMILKYYDENTTSWVPVTIGWG